jgi:opacity protein-like surface antigen
VNGGVARLAAFLLAGLFASLPAAAQDGRRLFAGALAGVSTLEADGRATTNGSDAAVSLYKPENGPALNLFAGVHVMEYFSVQVNWLWNRNDVTLVSSLATPDAGAFYEQRRESSQTVGDVDALIYFRRLDSRVRPYLGTGLALLRFVSDTIVSSRTQGLEAPVGTISSTRLGLRSHVGIDVAVSDRVRFRYSFSETISGNPISPSLTPPGARRLANFENLFGIVRAF